MCAFKTTKITYLVRYNRWNARGNGTLWVGDDSIFMKSKKRWGSVKKEDLKDIQIANNNLARKLHSKIYLNLKSSNIYMLKAHYHYTEGESWVRA